MARSVSEALRNEMNHGRAITREEWFSSEYQAQLDYLFDAVAVGGAVYDRAIAAIRDLLPDVRAEQSTAAKSKEQSEFIVNELRRNLDEVDLSALRAERMPADAKLGLTNHVAYSAYAVEYAATEKVPPFWPDSAAARYFILKVLRGVWWAQKGGLDSAKEHLLHNDGYDDEYILVGSFFDGTLSNERRVMDASVDLMRIIALDSSNALTLAFNNYKEKR
jgi:hypothetical protein